jgi:hypothetical protein
MFLLQYLFSPEILAKDKVKRSHVTFISWLTFHNPILLGWKAVMYSSHYASCEIRREAGGGDDCSTPAVAMAFSSMKTSCSLNQKLCILEQILLSKITLFKQPNHWFSVQFVALYILTEQDNFHSHRMT